MGDPTGKYRGRHYRGKVLSVALLHTISTAFYPAESGKIVLHSCTYFISWVLNQPDAKSYFHPQAMRGASPASELSQVGWLQSFSVRFHINSTQVVRSLCVNSYPSS